MRELNVPLCAARPMLSYISSVEGLFVLWSEETNLCGMQSHFHGVIVDKCSRTLGSTEDGPKDF